MVQLIVLRQKRALSEFPRAIFITDWDMILKKKNEPEVLCSCEMYMVGGANKQQTLC